MASKVNPGNEKLSDEGASFVCNHYIYREPE